MAEQNLLLDAEALENMPVVSIIIPCYNAERWLAEAIDSALAQTYLNLEIIIVDDGSTDDSRTVLERYRDRIHIEYRPHINGNAARNHGLRVSSGRYIQFLDADDYLLPDKIANQVKVLEHTAADVVYGDWRYQNHAPNDQISLSPIALPPPSSNIKACLLTGWTRPGPANLYRRTAIDRYGGWDETLAASQDIDFNLGIALTGSTIVYAPGCYFMYRRYGVETVSANQKRRLTTHLVVLQKWERYLRERGQLTSVYANALSAWRFTLAQEYYQIDQAMFHKLVQEIITSTSDFVPRHSLLYAMACRIFGLEVGIKLAHFGFPITSRLRIWARKIGIPGRV